MTREETIAIIQQYFADKPVSKVEVFDSFSRGEERPDSDIDLIVTYDELANITLFTIGQNKVDLEDLLNKKIDLGTNKGISRYVLPLIANERKVIYERA